MICDWDSLNGAFETCLQVRGAKRRNFSDAPELEFHEPSRAELYVLKKRAESELDLNFFQEFLLYSLEVCKREGNIFTYIRAK